MNAAPLKQQKHPLYPTRLDVQAAPEVLRRHLPPSWKSCAEIAGAIAVFLTATGCADAADQAKSAGKAAVVAPVFQHGDGRGATGCVVVAAPVFLSEEDAWQVIAEELGKSGISLSNRHMVLPGVTIPQNEEHYTSGNNGFERQVVATGKLKPLTVDGYDPSKKVAIEFVNAKDYFDLGGARSMSTVQGYDFPAVARNLDKQVQAGGEEVYFGAFYDPLVGNQEQPNVGVWRREEVLWQTRAKTADKAIIAEIDRELAQLRRERLAKSIAEAQRLLRLQVIDFIAWLKAQGVI